MKCQLAVNGKIVGNSRKHLKRVWTAFWRHLLSRTLVSDVRNILSPQMANQQQQHTRLFVGFDIGTQSLKAVVIDDTFNIKAEAVVHYDTDLPEFRTRGGVNAVDTVSVTSSPVMWVKAIDLVLHKLKANPNLDLSLVIGISGSAQQHGSVYWKKGARKILKSVQFNKFLHQQIQNCFSVLDSPVWMDSSTSDQCRRLEKFAGGARKLCTLTGSAAYERFTASQIMKIFETQPNAYNNTERISLVSSFAASLFTGDYASIDFADGSGMNLMDIRTRDWNEDLLRFVAPDLREKLGILVPAFKNLGIISPYFVDRFGFSSKCNVIAFTGDNPATVAGSLLRGGDILVSLGTSDTIIFLSDSPVTIERGHVMCCPFDLKTYFIMLCFKNGSCVRDRICDQCAGKDWNLFNEILNSTPIGNFGNLGMYFDVQEIIPFVSGEYKFNKQNEKIKSFSKEVEVRALIEGQVISKRVHAERLGFFAHPNCRIVVTGGASRNKNILQVFADVFKSPVYTLYPNSAALGAAYLAKYGLVAEPQIKFHETVREATNASLVTTPNKDAAKVYDTMVNRYGILEAKIIEQFEK